jgi:dihydrofolate synthase / folylpolyglutamate synthase
MERGNTMSQFAEAVNWIESLKKFGIKPGLERMEWVLEQLGNPERRLKFVHIAGTNGKGSTLQYIFSVLRKAGYTVGTYISPAMGGITNRIQCNGLDISESDFASLVDEIKGYAKELENTSFGALTEFEVTTLVAIVYFARIAYPDLVVWETGLGGRLDCTNVVFPLVSVITNVSFDHMNILGNTLEEIAVEKAGIIKNGVPVATAVEDECVQHVIKETALKKNAPIYQLRYEFGYERLTDLTNPHKMGENFHFNGLFSSYRDLNIPLVGEHQIKNASLAIMALEILRQFYAVYFSAEDLLAGLQTAQWPGRFEIKQKDPYLILDGAHNIEGADALCKTFNERFPGRKAKLLFSALADKDVSGLVKRFSTISDEVIVTKLEHDRAADPTDLEMHFRDTIELNSVTCLPDWRLAINEWLSNRSPDDILLASGSLYFITDIRRVLGKAQASCSDLLKERADD